MNLPKSRGRVIRHSPDSANLRIEHELGETIAHYLHASPDEIDERLRELDSEWDIERTLETNAALVSLVGLGLGAGVDRRFFIIPAVVAGFLLQHGLQGWCPPVEFFRRMKVRTTEEIEAERYALKYIRGDFGGPESRQASAASIAEAVSPFSKGGSNVMAIKKGSKMPSRDTTGDCEGECRDRVKEGEAERQQKIASEGYSEPSPESPDWTKKRNDPPGSMGGRV